MIVTRRHGRILVVRQVDHQDQCGLMAAAWGNRVFSRPRPYGALVVAACVHDEGWRRWEETPVRGEDGGPLDFPHLPRGVHIPLYAYGIDAAVARDPRAGLVVCMHGRGLYEKRLGLDGTPPPRATRPAREQRFIHAEEARQHRLERRFGEDVREWAWAGYRLLQAWDSLSLYLTWRGLPRGDTWTLPSVPRHAGDVGVALRVTPMDARTCAVDPWPFSVGEVALPVQARSIPDRVYPDDATLRAALADAPWETLPLRAVRAP